MRKNTPHNIQLTLGALAPSDVCTPGSFANGFAILSNTPPSVQAPLNWVLDALLGAGRISTTDNVKALIAAGDVRVSEHGWDELEADDISVRTIIGAMRLATEVEDYPEFGKGPSVLVLIRDDRDLPIHVV